MTPSSLENPVDRLANALQNGRFPPEIRKRVEEVLARLSRPVRIAVFGRAPSGPAALVNALLDETLLPESADMPPMALRHGDGRNVSIVTCDGARSCIGRDNLARLDPISLAMVELSAPASLLEKLSFLVVPIEGDGHEIAAALDWAASRAEMAICCSSASTSERLLWQRLPGTFLDHGFLAITAPIVSPSARAPSSPFRAAYRVGYGASARQELDRLRDDLLTHVGSAAREDLEGALALLARHQPKNLPATVDEAPVPIAHARPEPSTLPMPRDMPHFFDLPDPPATDGTGADGSAGSQKPAAEIVRFLSAQAETLSELCNQPDTDALTAAAPAVLAHCVESIEACNAFATPSAPAVVEMVAEASDLILLMQIESTREAMTDAVALMLQLRHDCEALPCA